MEQADPAIGDPATDDPDGGEGATTVPELRERGAKGGERLADFGAATSCRRLAGQSAAAATRVVGGEGLQELSVSRPRFLSSDLVACLTCAIGSSFSNMEPCMDQEDSSCALCM